MDKLSEVIKEMDIKMESTFILYSELRKKINSSNINLLRDAQKFSDEILKVYLITNENKIYLKNGGN